MSTEKYFINIKATIPSILGRLLYEVSWEGNATHYRNGGRGRENVLTAEVLQILDWLPREHFLSAVISSMYGAKSAREKLIAEVEEATIEMFPTDVILRPSATRWQKMCAVQADGQIESPSIFCLIEAKRIRRSSFQQKQLARELVATVIQAKERIPLLALILGEKPPVLVAKHGRLSIAEAVYLYLTQVVGTEAENLSKSYDEIKSMVTNNICWITWEDMCACMQNQIKTYNNDSRSVVNAVDRMVGKLSRIIEWHK